MLEFDSSATRQSMYAIQVNINLDCRFVMMEHRGLQFLLKGESLALYKSFLAKPIEYQQYIRDLMKGEHVNV